MSTESSLADRKTVSGCLFWIVCQTTTKVSQSLLLFHEDQNESCWIRVLQDDIGLVHWYKYHVKVQHISQSIF